MHIVVAGGSGLLGSALVHRLRAADHDVVTLTRRPLRTGDLIWDPTRVLGPWVDAIGQADAVINLSGESLDTGRWTNARKAAIRDSRIRATRAIVEALSAAGPVPVLMNASAIGIYGAHGSEIVTEATPPGNDFLASVCREWEREAERAAPRSRVVLLRSGLVLARHGGALPRLAMPYYLFAGGPAGSGRQYWSWIHIDDWVGIVEHMLASTTASGAVNLTAPRPVTNLAFSRALGRALRRPALLPAPAFALRILLGEMADALILNGQRVVPVRAEASGYRFRHDTVDTALRSLFA